MTGIILKGWSAIQFQFWWIHTLVSSYTTTKEQATEQRKTERNKQEH